MYLLGYLNKVKVKEVGFYFASACILPVVASLLHRFAQTEREATEEQHLELRLRPTDSERMEQSLSQSAGSRRTRQRQNPCQAQALHRVLHKQELTCISEVIMDVYSTFGRRLHHLLQQGEIFDAERVRK
ncbi:hypothetical protein NPIL_440271 [Nephila pilipes]|uniref:Uncharacterized protein n=1 Tax=Nephila pilipes TaxID=299642 RepID=A0A8X6TGQ8_NEPPI|nr:hypothetical protein NPIL_440271 [Nephila pilipes]